MDLYKSEEEFLKNYDSSIFEKLSMTADILILSVSSKDSNNYRKTDKKMMSVLLVKRDDYPYKGMWCLPGGFLHNDETLDDAAKRVLTNETNLTNKTETEMMKVRNLGKKSLDEVTAKLHDLGLDFAPEED